MISFDIRGNESNVHFYVNDVVVANTLSLFSETIPLITVRHQVTLKLNMGDTICLKATNKRNSKYVSSEADHFQESLMGYILKVTLF